MARKLSARMSSDQVMVSSKAEANAALAPDMKGPNEALDRSQQ